MEEKNKRVINVNPDLFRIPDTTRKKQPKPPKNKEIKVKTKSVQERNKTMKNKLLKFIRAKQQDLQQKRSNNTNMSIIENSPSSIQEYENDFQDSLNYLSQLVEENDQQQIQNNHPQTTITSSPLVYNVPRNTTIKQYSPHENVHVDFPNTWVSTNLESRASSPSLQSQSSMQIIKPPQYGCMKNGSLPTYRSWKNQTQKQMPVIQNVSQVVNTQPLIESQSNLQSSPSLLEKNITNPHPPVHNPFQTFKQTQSLINASLPLHKKPRFLKKIKRRKFTLGRSKKHPKVSVLISNKTIRKNVDTKRTHLKQTPMEEVKKFLIKNGFIKVGSVAPDSILRNMYENVYMICGSVTNHNSKNLLYNYFNYNE